MTDSKKNKIIKKIAAVLWWVAVILLAFILFNVLGAKMRGEVPSVFGYSVVNIISGSMEDEIPKNSYILIKKVDASKIKKDDIICFYSTDPSIYGMPNTHRVVEEPIITDTGIEFVTKGDANSINDKVRAEGEKLIGIYVGRLDWLTPFSAFMSGNTIFVVIFCLQIAIIGIVVFTIVKAKAEKKTGENSQENSAENTADNTGPNQ